MWQGSEGLVCPGDLPEPEWRFLQGETVLGKEKDMSGSQERRREPDPAGSWVKVAQLIGKLLKALAAGEHRGAGSGHQGYPRACYSWDPICVLGTGDDQHWCCWLEPEM